MDSDEYIKEKTKANIPAITTSLLAASIGDIVLFRGQENSLGKKIWTRVSMEDTETFVQALSFFEKYPGAVTDPNYISGMRANDMIALDVPDIFFMFKQEPCDTKAAQILLERSWGKVADKVELSGEIKGLNQLAEKAGTNQHTQTIGAIPSVFFTSKASE